MTATVATAARWHLGRPASFGLLVLANVVLMASTSAPSPLYPMYSQRWGFSLTVLTVVFAVYVAGLVGALLTVGSLSDRYGRRPVLAGSLMIAAAGTALFWSADGVVDLVLARIVQGVATGTATGALAAGLVEFAPADRPQLGPTMTAAGTSFGLALGGGLTGLLVAVTTHPDAAVFAVLTTTFIVVAGLIAVIPETAVRRPAASRPRIRIPTEPREARVALRAAVPAIAASWAATGLFLSLAPSLMRDVLRVGSGAAGGLAITVLFVANSTAALVAGRYSARAATAVGSALLASGAASLAASLVLAVPAIFLAASAIVGLGVGMTFNGTLREIGAATAAESRSQVFSAAFLISYAALGLPALVAGLAAPSWGLQNTSYLYTACVVTLSMGAAYQSAKRKEPSCKRSPYETARPVPTD